MPTIPTVANLNGLQHTSTMLAIISSSDLKSFLADALLSFSPLATLVGVDAVRSLAHRSTNLMQFLAVSVAPIGTLGVMATICKASNIRWLKVMLGAAEQNIYDAAREVGCGVAIGSALPRMDQFGDLISDMTEEDYSHAAHAIVRFKWRIGVEQRHLDFDSFRWITENFAGATVSGRVRWRVQSDDAIEEMVSRVQEILRRSSHGFAIDAFEAIHQLNGGHGIVELSWPAPAMRLEIRPLLVFFYIFLFLFGFSLILVLPAHHSVLPVTGFGLLVIGHFGARFAVQRQRLTLHTSIPKMNSGKAWDSWMLVDKPRFPTALARRSFFPSSKSGPDFHPGNAFSSSRKSRITLSQHHQFKRLHTGWVVTVLTLTILCSGFFVFYLGVKSSSLTLVIPLLVVYIVANILKGSIILSANESYRTGLNSPGHPRVDKPYSRDEEFNFVGEEQESQHHAREDINGIELTTVGRDANPGNAQPGSSAVEEASSFSDALTIYCKFQARDRKGIDLFCFSSPHEWIIAARIIIHTIKPFHTSSPPPTTRPQRLLRVPVYSWRPRAREGSHNQCRGVLLMAIENIKLDELFWSVGMEIAMIILGNYQSPRLCSEHKDATNRSLLGSVVYSCTRILLSEFAHSGNVPPNMKQLGVQSLMRSIDNVANSPIDPRQDIPSIDPTLRAAANAAITASAAMPIAQVHPAPPSQGHREVLEESNAESDGFPQPARLRLKQLKDLDKLLDKLMAYLDVMINERWTSLPMFKPCWMEILKACEDFRDLACDEPREARQQSHTGISAAPEELEEEESTFELPGLPQQRATFNALLLQELRYLEAYQNSGLMPHHSKLLVPAQRAWLKELLVFQRVIQFPSPPAPHQPAVHAPTIDSHFDEHSQQLWQLYQSPRLRRLQYLQDLQYFLRFLESDLQDTYSPFRKQVADAVECANHVTTYFAQAPLKPWARMEHRSTSRLLLILFVCFFLSFMLSFFALPVLIKLRIIQRPHLKIIVGVYGASFGILTLVVGLVRAIFIHPKLAYTMSCKKRRSSEQQSQSQGPQVVLTEHQAIRSLIHEIELLQVETIKRRAPLLIALREERGDWDQIEAEYEQENNVDGPTSM